MIFASFVIFVVNMLLAEMHVMEDHERSNPKPVHNPGRRGFIKARRRVRRRDDAASDAARRAACNRGGPRQPARKPSACRIDLHPIGSADYAKARLISGGPWNPLPTRARIDQRRKWMDEHGARCTSDHERGCRGKLVTPEGGRLAKIVKRCRRRGQLKVHDRFSASIDCHS